MATSEQTPSASDSLSPTMTPTPEKGLRLWPAAFLLVLLGVTRLLDLAFEEMPPQLYAVLFFGPLAATTLTVLWWLLFSRSPWRARLLAFALVAAGGVASVFLAHETARGMVFMFFTMPIATATFLGTLLVLGWFNRGAGTWGAVIATLAVFAAADLVRNQGFSGDFKTTFDWRWKASAAERYLAKRQASAPAKPASAAGELGVVGWPGFRGAKRDSVVTGTRLVEDWKAHPPKEVWRREVGPGWSSFALAGSLLFTQEQRDKLEAVVCWDANSGAEVWSYEYPARFWEAIAGEGPRATPTLHDGALYTLGADGALCRLEPRTGKLVWTRDLKADADRTPPMWGFSSSPLIIDGMVIVHAGGEGDKGLLAYDAQTGSPRWQAPADGHSYSSPHLATIAGKPVILMLTNAGLTAHDPATGKIQWQHDWKFDNYRALQPLVFGDTSILLGTMIGSGTRRIDLQLEGGEVKIAERWTTLALRPGFNDYVAHKGHLFGFDNNIFACIDLEAGKKKWKDGRYGTGQVLLLPDADQLLVISEKGELVLLRANPERHEELTRFQALSGKTWNHPILVGNRLYLRNGEEAACFEMAVR